MVLRRGLYALVNHQLIWQISLPDRKTYKNTIWWTRGVRLHCVIARTCNRNMSLWSLSMILGFLDMDALQIPPAFEAGESVVCNAHVESPSAVLVAGMKSLALHCKLHANERSSFAWAHSEGHQHTEGTFTGTLMNVGNSRGNSCERQGGSCEHRLWVRQSSPNFVRFLPKSSREGARRMLLLHPRTCLICSHAGQSKGYKP